MQSTRQNLHTQIAPLAKRQDAWQAAVMAAQEHIRTGKILQKQGVEVLKSGQIMKGDPAALARLIQQATTTIEKGTKVERDAHRELIDLQQQQPTER